MKSGRETSESSESESYAMSSRSSSGAVRVVAVDVEARVRGRRSCRRLRSSCEVRKAGQRAPRAGAEPQTDLQLALDLLLQLVLGNLVLPPNRGVLCRMLRAGERAPLVFGDNLVAVDELEVVAKVVLGV